MCSSDLPCARAGDGRLAQGIDCGELAQRLGGPRAADDRAEENAYAAKDRGCSEPQHSRTHRGAEYVCGVIRSKRPAQKQPAGKKNND